MLTKKFSSKSALFVTRVIYFGQVTGLVCFFLVAAYLTSETSFFKANASDPFIFLIIVLTCVAIPIGYIQSIKIFKKVKPESPINEKYSSYQSGFIIRIAFCNGVGLFSLVCLLISSNQFFLLFFLIGLTVMILNYPTPRKIGEAIELTQAEIESFNE